MTNQKPTMEKKVFWRDDNIWAWFFVVFILMPLPFAVAFLIDCILGVNYG